MGEAKLRAIETIDAEKVKEAAKVLNASGLLEKKIKVVGVSKPNLVQAFIDATKGLSAGGKEDKIPDSVVEAYNYLFTPPKEGEAPAKPADKPPKEKKERKPPVRQGLKFKTFDELKAFLAKAEMPTNKMDAILLEGGTLADMVKKFKETVGASFKSPSQLKAHIKYREEKSNWIFTVTGEGDAAVYKLTGVKAVEVKA